MARVLLFSFVLFLSASVSHGQVVAENYDTLSRMPSEQLMQRGRQLFEQRQGNKALACFAIVGERYQENATPEELRQRIRALNNCACVYKYFFFEYIQAYEYFTRAYDLCEQAGYDEFLPVIMVNLGDLLNDYGTSYQSATMVEHAQALFEQCIERAVEQRNWELMTTAFFNLSNQNYTLDVEPYREILFSPHIPDSTPDLQYVRLQLQAMQALQQGHYGQARHYFRQQLPVVSARWEAERDTIATYLSIAHTYHEQDSLEQESEYLLLALARTERSQLSDQDANICKLLAQCYGRMDMPDMQQHYQMQYLEKKEQLHANRLVNIAELNYIHELKKEQERAHMLSERQRLQQLVLLAVGIVMLVVILSAVLLWRKNRELQRRNRILYDKSRQLQRAEQENQRLLKYHRSSLSDEQKAALTFRIQEILATPEEICQQDFTLAKLARRADSNTTYVSQVINECYGTGFSAVLAAARIKEACRRMSDETDHYSHITIEAIASSVGFKSRTAFINAFKREVGLTPSEYLRMATL